MKAGPIEIGRLLQNRQRFCVPIYQRHYVWTRQKQWEPFWNDIRTKAIECLAGRERRFSHFMGAVVLEARGGFSAGKVPSFQVVDGQQRLTTFQLFLAAARDYAISVGFCGTAEKINSYLINDKPHLMEDSEVESYKVWPTKYDRALFIDIINGDRAALRTKYPDHFYVKRDKIYNYSTVPNLLAAYGYFFDQIKYAVESEDLDDEFAPEPELDTDEDEGMIAPETGVVPNEIKLDAVWQALVEEFKVVEIVLEDGDDAQVIFETLNERGEPLLAADLVRNNIFHRADAAGEKADKLFDKYWRGFEVPFWSIEEKQGRYKKPRIEFFIANFIAGKIASEVNLTKLFSEYKAFLKPSKNKPTAPYSTVEDEIKDLSRYGEIYKELLERDSGSSLATFSKKLLPWDVTTVFPLVIRLWGEDIDANEKSKSLDILMSFIVRRGVCGLTTKNYNKLFLSAIFKMDDSEWSAANLAKFFMDQSSESGRFPRNEEFEKKFISLPAYLLLQSKTRAVLEEIESAKRTKFHETTELSDGLTVEHVMPRQWKAFWPLDGGAEPTAEQTIAATFSDVEDDSTIGKIVKRNRLLQSFGNLTLLTQPLNSSVSNGSFEVKKKALKEHSLLVLNREIVENEKWNETEIENRGKALYQYAQEIWPLPKTD